MTTPLFVALIALVPGIVAWWTGRRLTRMVDDPALPELLMARRQRVTLFVAIALATMVVFGGRHSYWGVPLIGAALLAGGYPLRRRLALETAGLGGYLWRGAKSIIGSLGFWVVLAWTPAIVLSFEPRYRLVSLALLPVLFLWEQWYPQVWLRLHDAVLFTSDALAPRIAAIVERAGIAAPALYRIGAPGTRIVNALAFPSVRRPAIGMGNALLELLEPDEAAAIYAHELSHIEQHSPRLLRRRQIVNQLMIVAAVAAPPAAQSFAPDTAQWVATLWPVVVLVALVQRGRQRQKHETESDLRAAALCGDPEAVVRGLIKVHVHAFIPRRWAVNFERDASHPSLARRIQALRGEGPRAVGSLGAPTVLATAREGSVIAFDDARAYWFDGVPGGTPPNLDALRATASSVRSVAWPELVELRVTTTGAERALRAMHKNGDSWSVPLGTAQVAQVQKALDLVDVRLHRELGRRPSASVQLVAVLIFFAMTFAGEIGILLVPAALALFRPSTAAIAALGTMASLRAVFGLVLGDDSWIVERPTLALAALAALGVLAVWIAWRRARREGKRDGARLTLGVLGAVAALLLIAVATIAPLAPLRQLADHPALTALAATLGGLAAALTVVGSRAATWAAAGAGTLALMAGAFTLTAAKAFRSAGSLTRSSATAVEVARVDLGATVTALRLSPGGARFLVQRIGDRGLNPTAAAAAALSVRHTVGALPGPRRDLYAMQVEFMDDEHLLVLRAADQALELRLETADSGSVIWTARLPVFFDARLAVSPRDRAWAVVGEDGESDSLFVASGTSASPDVVTHRFPPLGSLGGIEPLVFDHGARLLVPSFMVSPRFPAPLSIFGMYAPRVSLWEVLPTGRRQIAELDGYPQCGQPDEGLVACYSRQRNRGRVWTFGAGGEPRLVGELALADAGLVTVGPGARLTVTRYSNHVIDVDATAATATDVRLPTEPGIALEARTVPGQLVVLRNDSGIMRLVRYRVP
jgi:Zn-dependent protease with chaperone function